MGMFSSSQIRIRAIPCWLFELGIWRELNTGKSFCTEVTYQKQVALLSVRMQQTNRDLGSTLQTSARIHFGYWSRRGNSWFTDVKQVTRLMQLHSSLLLGTKQIGGMEDFLK